MMQTQAPERKYGRNNISMTLEGTDIVIRIDGTATALNGDGSEKVSGSPNPTKDNPNKVRVVDLVGTSGGFTGMGECQVSVNVTRA